MSKGSAPRPLSVPQETWASNWERTFGNTPSTFWVPGVMLGRVLPAETVRRLYQPADPETREKERRPHPVLGAAEVKATFGGAPEEPGCPHPTGRIYNIYGTRGDYCCEACGEIVLDADLAGMYREGRLIGADDPWKGPNGGAGYPCWERNYSRETIERLNNLPPRTGPLVGIRGPDGKLHYTHSTLGGGKLPGGDPETKETA